MKSYWRHFILPGLLGLLSVSGLRAQIIYADNTVEPTNFAMVVTDFTSFATPFVTDNSASSFLVDLVYFDSGGSPGDDSGDFVLDIYTDAGGQPGVSLTGGAGLSGTDNPLVPTGYPYAPTSPITLQPDTQYWVVASISSEFGGEYEWQGTFSNTIGYWMLPLQASIHSDGWNVLGGDGLKVAITATGVVPEPGQSVALAGLLALGAALRRGSGRWNGRGRCSARW
jgi:hypothetical protein